VLELSQPADPLFKGKRFYSPVVFTVSKSSFINGNCQLCVCVYGNCQLCVCVCLLQGRGCWSLLDVRMVCSVVSISWVDWKIIVG